MATKFGFCGAGNMGKAMIRGILGAGLAKAQDIYVFDAYKPGLEALAAELKIIPVASEEEAAKQADILILAVKPDVVPAVLQKVKGIIGKDKIVVSIAAGVSLERLENNLEAGAKAVRVMPNTPALVGEGMAALCPNKFLSEQEKDTVLSVFSSFGKAEFIAEKHMDAIVGLIGSGPAYVYMFIEALADGAVFCGMPRDVAYRMAAQTVLGSAKTVMQTGQHPGALKDMVCSPGGTSIAAVRDLEERGFRSAVINAVRVAAEKNSQL
ncbi:pyrroline-5-carboxylate reductase [Desulfovibrio sp. OttesenSCG-928-C06]|nr:pyrroline-5-carboxylate reductase [Desulfovibrio sp. OttesenSCG-928-C06]